MKRFSNSNVVDEQLRYSIHTAELFNHFTVSLYATNNFMSLQAFLIAHLLESILYHSNYLNQTRHLFSEILSVKVAASHRSS